MNTFGVVQANHVQRQAVVYVRQSTPHQALNNQESRQMQYGLERRAVELGWTSDDVRVVDSDVGRTGSSAKGRRGFQELVADVTYNQNLFDSGQEYPGHQPGGMERGKDHSGVPQSVPH